MKIKILKLKKHGYDNVSRAVTWNIENLEPDKEVAYYLELNLNELQYGENKKNVEISAVASLGNNEEYSSNTETIKQIGRPSCTIKLETNLNDKYIYEDSEFEYIATIKNTGYCDIESLEIQDVLPNGITGKTISYTNDEKEVNSGIVHSATGIINIKSNEERIIKIKVTADKLADNVNELEVKNKITLSSSLMNPVVSNEVINIIRRARGKEEENYEELEENPIGNSGDTQKYSISGKVWLDEDRNGAISNEEKGIQDINIDLYNESGKKIVTTSKTTNGGEYQIPNLENGVYIAVFKYDNSKYDVTDYKKSGVDEKLNSDATKAELDDRFIAVTDRITINNENVENINLGLVNSSRFDLKLDKYINSVTLQSSNTTKKYSYNNANFAKIEVNRKTVNDTLVTIEYKINVTNEGETAGYAKQVIDYKEDSLNFNSKLNNGWSLSNGQLINTSLSNQIIKPGETKSLTLYLTKKLNENNLGTITNTAEIGETFNQNSLSDIDSTPNNKKSDEDDMSTVNLIISISTGKIIIYTSLIISTIVILGVGIYLINKKVLKS